MKILQNIAELRSWTSKSKRKHPRVLVPTMGALHEGHLKLIDHAKTYIDAHAGSGEVIVTIFVNPTQFGPGEDLDRYPRTLDADLAACKARGADAIFVPEARDIYRDDASAIIHENSLSNVLCGKSRPGHFDGVCTIVAKLFLLTQPDAAVFGNKDYQQLAVIRRMVRDFNFPIKIIGSPIVREPDGLAMSSRNRYLSAEHRRQALTLSRSLQAAENLLNMGQRNAAHLRQEVEQIIALADDARIDYIEVVDSNTLSRVEAIHANSGVVVALAVFFGNTRLIDNLLWMGDTTHS